MKKKGKILSLLTLSLVLCFAFSMAACVTTKKLETPASFNISGDTLSWSAVPNANGYSVQVDGGTAESVTEPLYDLSNLHEIKTYTIKVKAVGTGNYKDSEWGEKACVLTSVKLAKPTLTITDSILTWPAVSNATGGYVVQIDMEAQRSVTGTSFDLSDRKIGNYLIKVKAVGDGTTYRESDWAEREYEVTNEQLPFPTETTLNLSEKKLSWREVSHATGYVVQIDGVDHSIEKSPYDLSGLTEVKTYEIKVKAVGNDTTYRDSAWTDVVSYKIGPKLATPQDLVMQSGKLMWTAVESAIGYEVTFDAGTTTEFTETTELNVSFSQAGTYSLTVRAKAELPNHSDSDWSAACSYVFTFTESLQFTLMDGGAGYSVSQGTAYSLSTIVIPETYQNKPVIAIEDEAFFGCSKLATITIPHGITTIGDQAFSGCKSLKNLTIPASVTYIGNNIVEGCLILESITVNSANLNYTSAGGVLYNKAQTVLMAFPKNDLLKTTFMVPGSVQEIAPYAFQYANRLTTVSFDSGSALTEIGEYAFYNCTNLRSIVMPASLSQIGIYSFYNCANLATVAFGGQDSALESIGDYLFYGCTKLANITLPAGVESIGQYAFAGCTVLTGIMIPGNVISIGDYAFYNCPEITTMAFPASLETIGIFAFYCRNVDYAYDSKLASITFADDNNLDSIGAGAFYACTNLLSVNFGARSSLRSIGALKPDPLPGETETQLIGAFESCRLTHITLPASLTILGDSAFRSCNYLVYVSFGAEDEVSQLQTIGKYAFASTSSLDRVVIPKNVATIRAHAFNNSGVGTVDFEPGSNLTFLGNHAFVWCRSLTSIIIPEGITQILMWTFQSCIKLLEIIIPEGVTSIGNTAFGYCSQLEKVELPASLATMGDNAFVECKKLVDVEFAPGSMLRSMGTFALSETGIREFTFNDNFTAISQNVFNKCFALEDVYVGKNVTSIASQAFTRSALKNISFAAYSKLTSIGSRAFQYCYNLESIRIPEGVTDILDSTFHGCASLKTVVIPRTVKAIGRYAFSMSDYEEEPTLTGKSSSLTTIYLGRGEPFDLGMNPTTLYDSSALSGTVQNVYVPNADSVVRYKNAFFWNETLLSAKIKVGSALSAMTRKTSPAKANYLKGEAIDLSGGELAITHLDGTEEDISMTMSGVYASYNFNSTGVAVVTVHYWGRSVTYAVTVREVTAITLKTNPLKMTYSEQEDGEIADLTGGEIEVTYNDGAKETLSMTTPGVNGIFMASVGCIIISFYGPQISIPVTVTQ